MDVFTTYLKGFFGIGSKSIVNRNRKTLLESMISFVPHTLTEPQKLQARKNIGIDQMFKTGQRVWLTKGVHNVNFTEAFPAAYDVYPYGSTGAASFLPIITDVSHLGYFIVKMPVDGYLSWQACLVTEV
jgi:hypothetical protein